LSRSSRAWVSPARVGDADADFLERRLEQADHRLLHLVRHVVDDGVLADVDAFAVGDFLGVAVRAHVEGNDDGLRCRRQQHVRFVDRAHTRVNDPDFDLFV
jgi:hypothetical protein